MQIIADLHLHSKYSRAVSNQMVLGTMAEWGEKKGIDLLGTSDWTHPLWFQEIKAQLEEDREGVFKVKGSKSKTRYLLSCEISNIYTAQGKGRRIHTVFLAPSFETVEKINTELKRRGGNLMSDGRPILGLTMEDMCEVVWGIDERVMVIPAHVWTPWFSLFGSKSGFDSVEECFGKYADKIYAIETGLSSDPVMNWRIKDLDKRVIVSCSDAHSPRKMGREAVVFEVKERNGFGYDDVAAAFKERAVGKNEGKLKLIYTIEFHPEEGKYHYTGHRNCKVVQSPEETRKKGTSCHVCGKPLTVGVMHRVEELAQERGDLEPKKKESKTGVMGYYHPEDKTRPPYVMLVPLQEVLSEALGVGVASQKVQGAYEELVSRFKGEFEVLLRTEVGEISKLMGERVGEAIEKTRKGDMAVNPGYDGVFGEVSIWPAGDKEQDEEEKAASEQQSLF